MKRFLLLFCTVVLVCSIMIVPAFAAESYSFTVDDFCVIDGRFPPLGNYEVTIITSDFTCTLSQPMVLEVNYVSSDQSSCIFDYECVEHDIAGSITILFDEYNGQLVPGLCYSELWIVSSNVDIPSHSFVLSPFSSEPEPVTETFFESVGTFFTQSIAWFGTIAGVVADSPALLVTVIGVVIAGAIIGYLKRVKNM